MTAPNVVQFPQFHAPTVPVRIRERGGHAFNDRREQMEALTEYMIAKVTEKQVLRIHGIGPTALSRIKAVLAEHGVTLGSDA